MVLLIPQHLFAEESIRFVVNLGKERDLRLGNNMPVLDCLVGHA
jgi:hypothetical protein